MVVPHDPGMDHPTPFEKAQAHRVAMREALADTERALSGASNAPDWRAEVRRAVSRLLEALEGHVAEVESEDGLLAQLVDDAPRLENLVRILERDHRRLLQDCESIVEMIASAEPREVRARGRDLIGDLIEHRQQGSDLVYAAYSEDIGGQA